MGNDEIMDNTDNITKSRKELILDFKSLAIQTIDQCIELLVLAEAKKEDPIEILEYFRELLVLEFKNGQVE